MPSSLIVPGQLCADSAVPARSDTTVALARPTDWPIRNTKRSITTRGPRRGRTKHVVWLRQTAYAAHFRVILRGRDQPINKLWRQKLLGLSFCDCQRFDPPY
jgi:hypothetical protein